MTRRSILIFTAGAVSASTVFAIILIVNAPARDGIYLDPYTGDKRGHRESVFSSITENIESPNHAWAVEHGAIDPVKRSGGGVYFLLYRKPWFGRGECITIDCPYFDVVAAIRRRETWSEKQKIERLKEYHADLNARTSDYPWGVKGVMLKWDGLVGPGEPNPSDGSDAATPSEGEGRETE